MAQQAMNVKYAEENWPERLTDCQCVQDDKEWAGRKRVRERYRWYKDEAGNTICVTIEYTHTDGTVSLAVRMLRDGNIAYNAV